MANVISLQFSDQIQTNVGRFDYTGDVLDDTDLNYWLGTSGNTVSYVDVSTSGILTVSGGLSAAFNRNQFVDSGVTITSTATWTYADYSVLTSRILISLRDSGGGGGACHFVIEAKNSSGVYETITSFNSTIGGGFAYIDLPCTPKYWSKDFRFNRISGVTVRIDEIYIYGALRREDNNTLGLFPANSTIETVKDSQLNINSIKGPLNYQAALSSKPNNITSNIRTILTGDLELGNKGRHTIISLDPNSATRNVILPQFPRLDHYLKLINVDGTSIINVRETVGGPIIQELSNASTILTLEAIWDQTDGVWHITS